MTVREALLQANGSPTMVDMKDQMLAADMLRSGGADRGRVPGPHPTDRHHARR